MTGTYRLSHRLWLAAAAFHLSMMTLGALSVEYRWMGPFARAADFYGVATGAGYAYGFFAPGISGQLRALFDVTDRRGSTRTISLESGTSHEADLRIHNIIDQFEELDPELPDLHRSLSASLASTVFSRQSDASRVTVRLEHYEPVSMADYRSGARAGWHPVYQAAFEIRKNHAADSSEEDEEEEP